MLDLIQLVDIEKYANSKLQSQFDKLQMEYKKQVDTNVNLKGKIDVMEKHFRMKFVKLVYVFLLLFYIVKALINCCELLICVDWK